MNLQTLMAQQKVGIKQVITKVSDSTVVIAAPAWCPMTGAQQVGESMQCNLQTFDEEIAKVQEQIDLIEAQKEAIVALRKSAEAVLNAK